MAHCCYCESPSAVPLEQDEPCRPDCEGLACSSCLERRRRGETGLISTRTGWGECSECGGRFTRKLRGAQRLTCSPLCASRRGKRLAKARRAARPPRSFSAGDW